LAPEYVILTTSRDRLERANDFRQFIFLVAKEKKEKQPDT
jgi:hypothetical protein